MEGVLFQISRKFETFEHFWKKSCDNSCSQTLLYKMDEKDLQIIEEDSRQHPQCTYSQSLSKSHSNVNGKFVAEIIKHVQRHCPGERPVDVISSKTVSDNKHQDMDDDFPSLFGFPFGQNRGGGSDGGFGSFDPFSMLEKFMRFPDSNNNSRPPFEFGKPWEGRVAEDDDSYSRGPNKSKFPSNKFKGGVISGPVEEI